MHHNDLNCKEIVADFCHIPKSFRSMIVKFSFVFGFFLIGGGGPILGLLCRSSN